MFRRGINLPCFLSGTKKEEVLSCLGQGLVKGIFLYLILIGCWGILRFKKLRLYG
jgi:hypothetical protein